VEADVELMKFLNCSQQPC